MFSLVLACLSCDVCGDGREEAAEKGGKEAGHTLKWTCSHTLDTLKCTSHAYNKCTSTCVFNAMPPQYCKNDIR